eukprot:TRINITY_DN8772_c0_g1_i1.p1 TRINITY_DN8772_c0_g1~~TRINITY_DN8772_c0_g1_i1.p1  ORF type:complete len:204 (+),score=12.87 TRINITY_DN8772_c0_g1_i1:22-633(+)
MGVRSIFPFRLAADTQAISDLQRRLETLYPDKKAEKWTVNCALYLTAKPSPAPQDAKDMFIVHFDDKPKKCYLVVKNNILEADRDIAAMLEKMKLFKLRQAVAIAGFQYKIGDFVLRIGTILLASSTKGVVIELEYLPCTIPNKCGELMEEFFEAVLGPFEQKFGFSQPVNYGEIQGLPDSYSHQHATFQYMLLFRTIGLFSK